MQFPLTNDSFPEGTVVGAYPQSEWPGGGAPSGTQSPKAAALATATVTNALALFSGLEGDTVYWAAAQVSGAWRWVRFRTAQSQTARYQVADPEDVPFRIDIGADHTADSFEVYRDDELLFAIDKDGKLSAGIAGEIEPLIATDFGGVTGVDGVDQTTGITAALAIAESFDRQLHFPKGTYYVPNGLVCTWAHPKISGDGSHATTLKAGAGVHGLKIGTGGGSFGSFIRGLTITSTAADNPTDKKIGLWCNDVNEIVVEDVVVRKFDVGRHFSGYCDNATIRECADVDSSCNVSVHLPADNGNDIMLDNNRLIGLIAGVQIAGPSGGITIRGGLLNAGKTGVTNDSAAPLVIGKDYLTGVTAGISTLRLIGVSFEQFKGTWAIRCFADGAANLVSVGTSFNANTGDALGLFKCDSLPAQPWVFIDNRIQGIYDAALPFTLVGGAQSSWHFIEIGGYVGATFNGAVKQFVTLSELQGWTSGIAIGGADGQQVRIGAFRLRKDGAFSLDKGVTWHNLADLDSDQTVSGEKAFGSLVGLVTQLGYPRPNLLTDNEASAETDLVGFNAGGGTSITQSTTIAKTGTHSVRVERTTTTGNAQLDVARQTGTLVACTAGQTYSAQAKVHPNGATPRTLRLDITWYDASKNPITSAQGTNVDEVAGQWNLVTNTAVAPAGAAYMGFSVFVFNLPAGEFHYVDEFQLELGRILPWHLPSDPGKVGFYGATPAAKPNVTGAKGGNAALASLLTALAGLGLITDSTSA